MYINFYLSEISATETPAHIPGQSAELVASTRLCAGFSEKLAGRRRMYSLRSAFVSFKKKSKLTLISHPWNYSRPSWIGP